MNGLALLALRGLRRFPPAMLIAVFGVMVPYATASASRLHLPPPTPEPTELTTTLSGATTSGPTITLTEGRRVRDTATLTGPNAATAHGRVTYTLFADEACTQELGSRGASGVHFGSINASQGVRLPAGTYYWQASYSGDARDLPSVSACAAQTVLPFIPTECSAVVGQAHDRGEPDHDATGFDVSTDLSSHQRFFMHWEGHQRLRLLKLDSAACWVEMRHAVFHGTGTATLNGVAGYKLHFMIVVGYGGRMHISARVIEGREVLDHQVDAAATNEAEVFANGVPIDLALLS